MMTVVLHAAWIHAEYRIIPSLLVGEEYNDNIYLTPTDRFSEYITRVVPGVAFNDRSSLWDWDISYAYDYRYYERSGYKQDQTHFATLINRTRIIPGFLTLDVLDTYRPVSLDVTKDFTKQSPFVNQTQQNYLTVTPYMTLRPNQRTSFDIGYMYRNVWYKDPTSIDKMDNIVYTTMNHDISERLSSAVTVSYTDDSNRVQDYKKFDLSTGMTYTYSGDSRVQATIGNTWLSAEGQERETQVFWSAGFIHRFVRYAVFAEASYGYYVEDPQRVLRRLDLFAAGVRREDERTSWSVTGTVNKYRNAQTKELEDTSYIATIAVNHAFTERARILLDLSDQHLEDRVNDTRTNLYVTGARYEYTAWEGVTLAAEYRYTYSHSEEAFLSNYYNNRLIVEIRKAF